MKLTDAPDWPSWLEVDCETRGTVTLRVSLRSWRQRFSFAAWATKESELRWWERPLFFVWLLWGDS